MIGYMNILYFGTICDIERYDEILEKCKYKPSVSTIVFENSLLEGFKQNGVDVQIHSFPMIPTFPGCKKIFFGGNREKLSCGYECRWLSTVNLPIIKQMSRRYDGKKVIRKWVKENKENGIIFTYSIPPFLAKEIIKYSKKYSVKTVAIIPDLLRDMYINENKVSLVTKLKQCYIKPTLGLQGEYDGYVYLTEAMRSVVAPEKPYMVMEGIADINIHKHIKFDKSIPRAVMYAGMLHIKNGILKLVDAFEKLSLNDTELWLFGEGTASEEIKRRARLNLQIKFFGSRTHQEVLDYEQKATLLINPRDPHDEFTKYSFPSKTVEYMLSATPMLTTKLPGIPEEYYDYVFSSEDNSVENLALAIEDALSYSNEELEQKGKNARDFIIKEKNSKNQVARILEFMQEVMYNASNKS